MVRRAGDFGKTDAPPLTAKDEAEAAKLLDGLRPESGAGNSKNRLIRFFIPNIAKDTNQVTILGKKIRTGDKAILRNAIKYSPVVAGAATGTGTYFGLSWLEKKFPKVAQKMTTTTRKIAKVGTSLVAALGGTAGFQKLIKLP